VGYDTIGIESLGAVLSTEAMAETEMGRPDRLILA
jgi:hypothetical protein